MDRTRLLHVLTHLHDIVANDIPGLEFRVWFYGSRQDGFHGPESDLNLAIELLSPMADGEAVARWMAHRANWEKFVSRELGVVSHIDIYRGQAVTPGTHAALQRSAEIIYRSHPA